MLGKINRLPWKMSDYTYNYLYSDIWNDYPKLRGIRHVYGGIIEDAGL